MTAFETLFPAGRQLRQADLEAMTDEELREVRDTALEWFNDDLEGPHAEYLEILAGAASDTLFDRHLEAS